MLDLSTFSIDELVELKNEISNRIYRYDDGYLYICNVRSYGRNWRERITNAHTLEELCYQYSGDDGIVDVYSTNPNLGHIQNYGDLMYVPSLEDYEKWKRHTTLVREIPELEKEWEEWDNRENVAFRERRSYFAPVYSREDIKEMKNLAKELDGTYIAPVPYRVEVDTDSI
jgi:hypothetical protein